MQITDAAARSRSRRRGRTGLLVGGVCAVALVVAAALLPGLANAATTLTSNFGTAP